MSEPDRESLRDLAAGYVLGALSAEEARAFEAALAGSPELRREVAEFREVSARLAEQRPLTPPPALKARLLERIAAEAAAGERPALPFPERKSFAPVATAMALAAMVLLAVGLTLKVRVLGDTLRARDSALALRDQQLATREATLNAILEPGVQLTTLTATGAQPVVQIFYDRVRRAILMHAFRLPQAPPGRVYQLWLMPKQGNPIPSQTFNTEPDGHGLVERIAVPAGQEVTGFAVSVEPTGGSPQPTTTPILFARSTPGT